MCLGLHDNTEGLMFGYSGESRASWSCYQSREAWGLGWRRLNHRVGKEHSQLPRLRAFSDWSPVLSDSTKARSWPHSRLPIL